MKPQLYRAGLELLAAGRAERWMTAPSDAAGFALTLHHVRPAPAPGAFDPQPELSVTPDFLDTLLADLRARGWDFVALGDLVGDEGTSRRLAVTLDDGFRDNLVHAVPLFRKHQVPYTVFVCTGLADWTAELWWEALERIIAGAERIEPPGFGRAEPLPCLTRRQKLRAFAQWRRWLTRIADETEQREAIRTLAGRHGLDLAALGRELTLGWDELRALARDPLCTIGAHTLTHPALARLSAQDALHEMRVSADRIGAELGVRPEMLAFPYGTAWAATAREAELAERAGFSASFSTRPGYIRRGGSRHGLPRISVNGRFQRERHVRALLNPALWRLGNGALPATVPSAMPDPVGSLR